MCEWASLVAAVISLKPLNPIPLRMSLRTWGFPKIRAPFLGVLITRTIVY